MSKGNKNSNALAAYSTDETRKASKRHLVALMQTGHSWQEAAVQAGLQVSRSLVDRGPRQDLVKETISHSMRMAFERDHE